MALLSEVLAPISIVGAIGLYARWFRRVETKDEREERIRSTFKGEEFGGRNTIFSVARTFVSERDGLFYTIFKYIPFVRKLRGKVEITLQTKGINLEEYYWTRMSINEYSDDDLPNVEVYDVTVVQSSDDRTGGWTTEIELHIKSLDVYMIKKVLKEIPPYIDFILSEYPGDLRYHSKRGHEDSSPN